MIHDARVHRGHHELGHCLLEPFRDWLGRLARERRVHAASLERRRRRAPLADDQIPEATQIRSSLDEIVRVLHVLDELALSPLFQLEGPGPDATRAIAGWWHVSRVDRRVAGCEHQEQRGLRPSQSEHDGLGIDGFNGFDVRIPVSPRVDAEPGRSVRRLAKQVEGEFHVLRADGRAVVPPRSRPQEEDQAAVVVLPRPPLRQFADDRVHTVRGLERIEEHQVAEARHGRPHGRDRGSFVYREPLWQVLAQPQSEPAAVFGCLT